MFWLIYFSGIGLAGAMLYIMRVYRGQSPAINTSNQYHDTEYCPPVTVLICAHNEAMNLELNLPGVLNQQYPDFEVLVVNHRSTDYTHEVLKSLATSYKHLRCIDADANSNPYIGKKQALYEGYKHATHDVLVHTDADCKPASALWLASMVAPFQDPQVDIVAGYAPYEASTGWLADVIQIETIETYTSMKQMALAGFPYLAVGRNMAVRKTLVQSNYWNKFSKVGYADDDLMVQAYAHEENYRIVEAEEAFVYSAGEKNWEAWMRQKIRHVAAGKFYKPYLIRLLVIVPLARLFLLAVFLMVLSCAFKNIMLTCLSIPVIGLYALLYQHTTPGIRKGVGFVKFFWMHQLLVIYYLVFPILGLFYKKTNWQRNTPYR